MKTHPWKVFPERNPREPRPYSLHRKIEGKTFTLHSEYGIPGTYEDHRAIDDVRQLVREKYDLVRTLTNRFGEKAIYVFNYPKNRNESKS